MSIICPVAPVPSWRILAALYIKEIPVFHPTAHMQGPEQHPRDDAAKHFLAVEIRRQEQDLLSLGRCVETQQLAAAWEVQIGHQEKFLQQKNHATLEQVAQTGCGITILGGFQYSVRQSHSWPDLGDSSASSGRLDSVTCRGPSQPMFLWLFTYAQDASKIRISVADKRYAWFCSLLIS